MKALFLLLRVIAGLAAIGGLVILLLLVFLHSSLTFAKESVSVLGYVATLFTSGFTRGTPPPDPSGWIVSIPQAGLVVLFVAMIVSLFLPGARIFLHIIAVMAGIAMAWYLRMILTDVRLEIFCLPLLAAWFPYYAMCIFWSDNQPHPKMR